MHQIESFETIFFSKFNYLKEKNYEDNTKLHIRLIATAQSAAFSPFGFEMTNLYAPQSDG